MDDLYKGLLHTHTHTRTYRRPTLPVQGPPIRDFYGPERFYQNCAVPYIDGWLLVTPSELSLHQHLQTTLDLLQWLGICVSLPKFHLVPSH